MNSVDDASETVRMVTSVSLTTERPPGWRMLTRLRTTLESPDPGMPASKIGYARSTRTPASGCGVVMETVTRRWALGDAGGVQVLASVSQRWLQPSPSVVLPSSHCSVPSVIPLPHTGGPGTE